MSIEVYDPREEQLRAQIQALYETAVCKELGTKYFRNKNGLRADHKFSGARVRDLLAAHGFGASTAVQKRTGWGRMGSPSAKAVEASRERYAGDYIGSDGRERNLTDLILTRQSYEETLGMSRRGSFYRYTLEPTHQGNRFFVWPLPPDQAVPGPAVENESDAKRLVTYFNRIADPRETGIWWRPPYWEYDKACLSHWLPKPSVFRL